MQTKHCRQYGHSIRWESFAQSLYLFSTSCSFLFMNFSVDQLNKKETSATLVSTTTLLKRKKLCLGHDQRLHRADLARHVWPAPAAAAAAGPSDGPSDGPGEALRQDPGGAQVQQPEVQVPVRGPGGRGSPGCPLHPGAEDLSKDPGERRHTHTHTRARARTFFPENILWIDFRKLQPPVLGTLLLMPRALGTDVRIFWFTAEQIQLSFVIFFTYLHVNVSNWEKRHSPPKTAG